jgi:hypothetical protein
LVFQGRLGRENHYTWLNDIAAVRPIGPFPLLNIVVTSGEERPYFIFDSRASLSADGRAHPTRDEAVRLILATAAATRQQPSS